MSCPPIHFMTQSKDFSGVILYLFSFFPVYFIILRSRGKFPITDPFLIPTPSLISITIRDIETLYIHELVVL